VRDGKGKGGSRRERGHGKGREGSTWIFLWGPRVPSYATAFEEGKKGRNMEGRKHINDYACSICMQCIVADDAEVARRVYAWDRNGDVH